MKKEIQLEQILGTKSQLRFQVMVHVVISLTDIMYACCWDEHFGFALSKGDRSAQYYRKPPETIKAGFPELNLA